MGINGNQPQNGHLYDLPKPLNGHVHPENDHVDGQLKSPKGNTGEMARKLRFDTLQIHAGLDRTMKYGACALPIYQTVSFEYRSSAAMVDALSDIACSQKHLYSRVSNPTQDAFEKRIAALEDSGDALAFASGSAAVLAVISTLAGRGDNIIVSTSIHSGTYRQFRNAHTHLEIEPRYADVNDIDKIRSLVDERTKFIFVESIGNPMLSVPDFAELASICHTENNNMPLVVDATLTAAGYYCQPAKWGADIIIHSATKWIGGHGTTLGGLVMETGRSPWQQNKAKFPAIHGELPGFDGEQDDYCAVAGARAYMQYLKNEYLRDTGGCLGPFACQQLFIGVETLSFHQMALKYLQRGFGTVVNFALKGGAEEAIRVIDQFNMILNSTNVGDAKTIVGHHWSTTHRHFTREENLAMGVSEDLVRLSIGLEDALDIIDDFEQAFEKTR
ncbi:O-acetylhomoserine (thiol)-lyase [Beauveria bassiana]|uniref:O-acetylhomoserine (Thiol)-lyase n=1 Tax=Beauveria bassiana TaxID=176275 RepID=A0A2N6NU87_BEABA|nr:O-acetylhomoserine (thiol)-lyase [Beauveria bassiana]